MTGGAISANCTVLPCVITSSATTLNGAYDSLFDIPDENRKESLLDTVSLQLDMKHLEKTIHQILIKELQEKGYSQKDIAKLLNVSRQTIFNKLHR